MDFHYITYSLNSLLMLAVPIGLADYLTRRFRLDWGLWFVGAAVFILSQIVHIPFNLLVAPLLSRSPFTSLQPFWQQIIAAIFLGLSAGFFEEAFRYGMFRWWVKDARSWSKALLLGAGHGGAEAVLIGIIALIIFLSLVSYKDVDFSSLSNITVNQAVLAGQQVQAYWSVPWYDTLLGALERMFTIPTQIALAVIVLQTFTRKQWFWVWLAVLYHALLDAVAVLSFNYVGVYWTEAIVGGFAVVSIAIIFALRRFESQREPSLAVSPVVPKPVLDLRPRSVEERPEDLEKTKYQ